MTVACTSYGMQLVQSLCPIVVAPLATPNARGGRAEIKRPQGHNFGAFVGRSVGVPIKPLLNNVLTLILFQPVADEILLYGQGYKMTLLSRGSRIKRDIGRAEDEEMGGWGSSGDKIPSEALFVLALHLLLRLFLEYDDQAIVGEVQHTIHSIFVC